MTFGSQSPTLSATPYMSTNLINLLVKNYVLSVAGENYLIFCYLYIYFIFLYSLTYMYI